eukprot:4149346-Pleurochrysis_carterae.AAC.1
MAHTASSFSASGERLDTSVVFLGGGGGASKTGVPNALMVLSLSTEAGLKMLAEHRTGARDAAVSHTPPSMPALHAAASLVPWVVICELAPLHHSDLASSPETFTLSRRPILFSCNSTALFKSHGAIPSHV